MSKFILEVELKTELLEEIHQFFNIPNFINRYPLISIELLKLVRMAGKESEKKEGENGR